MIAVGDPANCICKGNAAYKAGCAHHCSCTWFIDRKIYIIFSFTMHSNSEVTQKVSLSLSLERTVSIDRSTFIVIDRKRSIILKFGIKLR